MTPDADVLGLRDESHVAREKKKLREVLEKNGWNLAHSAAALDCTESRLLRLLYKHPDVETERQEKKEGTSLAGRKPKIESKRQLLSAMRKARWNLPRAAKKLKAHVRTVRAFLLRYELEATYLREREKNRAA